MSEQIDALSLEKAMEELETIAVKMEQGNVTMEQTMQLYERGTLLAKHCKDKTGRVSAAHPDAAGRGGTNP